MGISRQVGNTRVNSLKELSNPRDAIFVVIGSRKRDITNIDNFRDRPWVQTKVCMDAAGNCRNIAQSARAKMLDSFGGSISSGMRDADQGDLRPVVPGVRAAEQGWNPHQ